MQRYWLSSWMTEGKVDRLPTKGKEIKSHGIAFTIIGGTRPVRIAVFGSEANER